MFRYQQPKRNRLLIIFTVLLVVLLAACGDDKDNDDKSGDHYTIGIINLTPALDSVIEGFKSQMAELGYVEGENLTYIYDGPPDSIGGLDGIAQSLVEANVDLIFCVSTPATQAVQRATVDNPIPCVFAPLQDPVGAGIVSSLTHPGGNMTGVTGGMAEAKRMELLARIVPELNRVYVPYNIDDPAVNAALAAVSEVADNLGIELVLQPARNAEEVMAALENIPDDVDAIFHLPDSILGQFSDELNAAGIEHKLPLSVPMRDGAYNGALMSYGIGSVEVGKQAARLADQILQGADPADLPVEVGEFFLTINLKTAEEIGLEISEDMLRQANTIIRADE